MQAERGAPAAPNAAVRALQRIVEVRPEEVRALLYSGAYFFCILSAYYVIRPIRDEMGLAGGVRNIPLLWTGTLLVMLAVHPLFAWVVARLSRKRFVSITYRFFMANLLIFFVLLNTLSESQNIWLGRAFYVWTSVFNLFIISVFWAFMADVFRLEQSKRLFGFIGVGGTLGGLVGAGLTGFLVEIVGPANLLLVSVVLLEVGVFLVRRLSLLFGRLQQTKEVAVQEQPIGGNVLAGLTSVARSPYLLGICAYMLLYTIASTVLYIQQLEIVEVHIADRAARTAFFAKIDFTVNALTLATQAFVTGRIIRMLGVALTLTLLPALCIVGFGVLGAVPTLAVLVAFQVLRRAGEYAVARPTRETLYTVVSREDKYKAKNFIDTFVYRSGDQIGAWSYNGLLLLGLTSAGIAFATVPIAGIWLAIGYWLGRKQAGMAREVSARGGTPVAAAPAVT